MDEEREALETEMTEALEAETEAREMEATRDFELATEASDLETRASPEALETEAVCSTSRKEATTPFRASRSPLSRARISWERTVSASMRTMVSRFARVPT